MENHHLKKKEEIKKIKNCNYKYFGIYQKYYLLFIFGIILIIQFFLLLIFFN
jgi:hypothetical protein